MTSPWQRNSPNLNDCNGSLIINDGEMEELIRSTMDAIMQQFRIAVGETLTVAEFDYLAGNVLARVVHSAPLGAQLVFTAVLSLLEEELEGQREN